MSQDLFNSSLQQTKLEHFPLALASLSSQISCLQVKKEAYHRGELLKGALLLCRHLILPTNIAQAGRAYQEKTLWLVARLNNAPVLVTNIRLGQKGLPMTNTLAQLEHFAPDEIKILYSRDTMAQCCKTFYSRNLLLFFNQLKCLSLLGLSCLV